MPVVIVTGYPDSEVMNEGLELGLISVLKKTFSWEGIRDLLKNLLTPTTVMRRAKARE